jgi:hypothetical protein
MKERIAINQYSKGSEFHHLYLNDDSQIGIYVPKEVHRKHWHNGKNKESMEKINKYVLEWLCSQDTIIGDFYIPFQDRCRMIENINKIESITIDERDIVIRKTLTTDFKQVDLSKGRLPVGADFLKGFDHEKEVIELVRRKK